MGDELNPRSTEEKEVTCALCCYLILAKVRLQTAGCRGNWWGAPGTTGVFYFTPIQVVVGVVPVGTDRKPCHHPLDRGMWTGSTHWD